MAKRGTRKTSKPGPLDPPNFTGEERIVAIHGKEPMLRRVADQALREALTDRYGEFETFAFEGRTAPLADVLDELRGYSLMQVFKLVIVDEADEFLTRHRDAITRYAEAPVDHAALLLRSEKWNKGKLDKLIDKHGQVVKCDAVSEADARKWLVERARTEHRVELPSTAAGAMVDRMGVDLMQLDTELAKLALLADDGKVTAKLIEETVGRQSDEEVWAAQSAVLETLATGSAAPALNMVDELVRLAGRDPVPVTYFVADIARKLALAHAMRRQGMSDFDITKALKVWPRERQQMFTRALGRLDADRARSLQRGILRIDARTKTGFGEGLRNLECFCANLADSTDT
ncbi:MAG: DNA polymerase III subunit delta [Phycisphaeraceae bacterium]